jgi:ABC-type transporter Mla subunit MlaD
MSKTLHNFDVDTASMALGKASGLAHMCNGQVSEADDNGRCDYAHIRSVLKHISSLVDEARDASKGAPPPAQHAVDSARAVSALLVSDALVDYAGRVGPHWNEEITGWAFTALSDVIDRAKVAVDAAA